MHPLLRPRWIAGHVLAVVTVVGFVNLGFWQLGRLEEKQALRETVQAAQQAHPVPIEAAPAGHYLRVTATGLYDGSRQTTVLRGQGGVSGYHVLTPFLFAEGRAVLVDRGWIPLDAEPPGPFARVQTITGTLWPGERAGNPPEVFPGAIRGIDPSVVAAFTDYELLADYLVLDGSDHPPGDLPVPPTPPEVTLGSHLSYSVQWFVFAAVVLFGYPLLLRRTAGRSGSRSAQVPDDEQAGNGSPGAPQ